MINQNILEKIREYVTVLDEIEESGGFIAVLKESFQAEIEGNAEEVYNNNTSLIGLAIKGNRLKKEVRALANEDMEYIVLHHQLVLAEQIENFPECERIKKTIEDYKSNTETES